MQMPPPTPASWFEKRMPLLSPPLTYTTAMRMVGMVLGFGTGKPSLEKTIWIHDVAGVEARPYVRSNGMPLGRPLVEYVSTLYNCTHFLTGVTCYHKSLQNTEGMVMSWLL
jgi:hypothetical protein